MNKSCDKCQLQFSREPGFYFGAAYVSYGISVAFAVAISFLGYLAQTYVYPALTWYSILGVVIFSLIALFPVSYGLSRSVWLNMFYSYGKGNKQGT